jgi:hypothetical protein
MYAPIERSNDSALWLGGGSHDHHAQEAHSASLRSQRFERRANFRVATQSPLVRRVKSTALPESSYRSVKNAFAFLSGRQWEPMERMHAHFDKWSQLMLQVV